LATVIGAAFAGDWTAAPTVLATVDQHMAGLERWTQEAVRGCLDYAIRLIDWLAEKWHRIEILVEQWLDGAGVDIQRGGTADLIVLCYDGADRLQKVVIVDHKCGFLSQGDAAEHLQLGCYAVMAHDRWRPLQGVVVHLAMGRRDEYTAALYGDDLIEPTRIRVRTAVKACREDEPALRPGFLACRWCRAMCFCRPLRERIMHATEEFALFGADPADRIRLAEDARLAKQFAREADHVAKLWRAQQQERKADNNQSEKL
jgi:hypothetical protein